MRINCNKCARQYTSRPDNTTSYDGSYFWPCSCGELLSYAPKIALSQLALERKKLNSWVLDSYKMVKRKPVVPVRHLKLVE